MHPEFIPDFNPEIPDFDPDAGHEIIDSLDQMIQTSCIPEERKERLYSEIYTMSLTDAVNLYLELKEKQIDRITSGQNYNQGHIKEHLNKLK